MPPLPTAVCTDYDLRPCQTAGLYGCVWPAEAKGQIYDLFLSLFAEHGLTPAYAQIRASGFGKFPLLFKRVDRRLRQAGLEEVSYIELFSMQAGGDKPITDWSAHGEIFASDGVADFHVLEELMHTSALQVSTPWKGVLSLTEPRYGYFFRSPRCLGPGYYVRGMNFGNRLFPDDYEDGLQLRITRWADIGEKDRVWEHGILRDIYPQNLLTTPHLGFRVEGRPFADWVAARDGRGQLSEYAGGMTLWEVSPEERERVGPVLLNASMLFNPYNEQWATFRKTFPLPD